MPDSSLRLASHVPPGASPWPISPRAPHFDVLLDAERAQLRLARPLRCSFGSLHALTLDLGRLPSPLDLSQGAFGLRGRRRRVVSGRLWVAADAIESWAAERGVRLSVDQASVDGVHITWLDEFGAVGVALDLHGDGSDLVLEPLRLRARSSAEPPAERLGRLARTLGFGGGAQPTLRAPLFWLLVEALSVLGQRAPEIDALPPMRVEAGEGGFWVTARAADGSDFPLPALPPPASIWPGSLALDASRDPDWWALELDLQRALQAADGEVAADAALVMASRDPSAGLWVEAARLVAPLCAPARGADLLVRAAARAGDDAPLLAHAAEAAVSAGPMAVFAVVDAIDESPCSATLRGELMALALSGLRRAEAPESSAHEQLAPLGSVDPRLAESVERALDLAPHSPDVRLLAGEVAAELGESAHALDQLRRAARGFLAAHRPTSAARASLCVAEVLDQIGRPGAAERVLVDARAETDDAPQLVASLAKRWAQADLVQDALRAYAALLRQPAGRDGLEHALEQAAAYALRQGNVVAATPLVMRLLRGYPQCEAGARLSEQLQQLEAKVSHVNGPWDPNDSSGA